MLERVGPPLPHKRRTRQWSRQGSPNPWEWRLLHDTGGFSPVGERLGGKSSLRKASPAGAHPLPRDRRRDPLSPMDKIRATGVDGPNVAEVMAHLDWGAQEGRRQSRDPGRSAAARAERVETPTGQSRTAPSREAPGGRPRPPATHGPGMEAIAEPDVLNGSLGGRPGRRAPHALARATQSWPASRSVVCERRTCATALAVWTRRGPCGAGNGNVGIPGG